VLPVLVTAAAGERALMRFLEILGRQHLQPAHAHGQSDAR